MPSCSLFLPGDRATRRGGEEEVKCAPGNAQRPPSLRSSAQAEDLGAPGRLVRRTPSLRRPCPRPDRLVGFFVKDACAETHLRPRQGRTGLTPDFLESPKDL